MSIELLELLSILNVPDNDRAIITSRVHSITTHFNSIDPSFMSRIHLRFSSFNIESSNDGIATSHKNIFICNLHALNRLFRCYETFDHFVGFKIDASDHFIPTRGEKHVESCGDTPHRDGIGELEHCHAEAGVVVPLSNCAIVGGRDQVVGGSGDDAVDSVCVANKGSHEFTLLIEGTNEAILIAGIDFLSHEAEGSYEPLVTLSLQGSRCV
jgi:hypothetical protein